MPLNIDWQQILLHLFNFVILFAILYFLLYKPVKDFMEKRIAYYQKLDDDAKANFADSEKVKEEYKSKLVSAEDEIIAEKEKARKEIEKINAVKTRQAQDEAAKILADARQTLEKERSKMIREAQNEISDMVVDAAKKLAAQSTTSDAYDRFLDTAKRSEVNE